MKNPFISILVAMTVLLFAPSVFMGMGYNPSSSHEAGGALYQCSMHPHIVSKKPENCPICSMRLSRVENSEGSSKRAERKILYYQHPMRPDVTSPIPAKDEMGMDYVPVYEGDDRGGVITIPGHGEVTISPERRQLIGLETAIVAKVPLKITLRTAGTVAHDPELYSFLSEYRQAVEAKGRVSDSTLTGVHERAEALIESAKLKLTRLGLTDEQITELLKVGQNPTSLILPAETPWVYAEIYQYESGLVEINQKATITTPALPGIEFSGTVKAVDAILNAMTRTLRVRIEVPDTKRVLKPEMFVDVLIEIPLGDKLAISEDALFDLGRKKFVFVDQGEGRLEPREIRVGYEADGYYEILEGLKEGEKVVNSANFLIDSESRFRSAQKAFERGKKSPVEKVSEESTAPVAGHQH